ncbi:MAG: hypothetical protein ACOX9C_02000 [Kiritimatiellia bacterium]|jgi:hypothetical protein
MDKTLPFIQKLGTYDIAIVEANPIVWRGELHIFEGIRGELRFPGHSHWQNERNDSYCRFRKVADNSFSPPFGHGMNFPSAYVVPGADRVVVTGNRGGDHEFLQTESDDLVHWTEPRAIFGGEGWKGYNTSVCRDADRNRHVAVFELGAPKELVGVPFTMFFAETEDFNTWQVIPGAIYGFDFYTGGPMLRWHGGFYYLFHLNGSYEDGFETHVVRSRDLKDWEPGKKNPVLAPGSDDKKTTPVFPPQFREYLAGAANCNASDLDMVEHGGNIEMFYSWGNQRGNEFSARAVVYGMTERTFCESLF